jgi:hypothetical protein
MREHHLPMKWGLCPDPDRGRDVQRFGSIPDVMMRINRRKVRMRRPIRKLLPRATLGKAIIDRPVPAEA